MEKRGVFPEFNDGNFLMFYLSPCTKLRELRRLKALLKKLPRGEVCIPAPEAGERGARTAWVALDKAEGRLCAAECGLFPPCVPLVLAGERVSKEAAERLLSANSTFGLKEGNILVFEEDA